MQGNDEDSGSDNVQQKTACNPAAAGGSGILASSAGGDRDSPEVSPTRSLTPVSNSGLLMTVTASQVDSSTIVLDGSEAQYLHSGAHHPYLPACAM